MTSSGGLGRRIRLASALAVAAGALLAPLAAAGPAHAVGTSLTVCSLNPGSVQYGSDYGFSPDVLSEGAAAMPTGSFTLSEGLTTLGTAPISGGSDGVGRALLFAEPGAAPGSYLVTATYSGDDNDLPSSCQATITVTPAGTVTAMVSSQNPLVPGQAVTYTASVRPTVESTVNFDDGGTVTFDDGGTPISGCIAEDLNSNGQASCAVTYAAAGSHVITAAYSGDTNYAASRSALTQVVSGRPPAITSASSATFVVGASGSFTAQTVGAPVASVTESGALPSGVTFTGNGDGTATLAGTLAKGTKPGSYPLVITASNGVSPDAVQDFTLVVKDPVTAKVLIIPGRAVVGLPVLATAVLSAGDSWGTVSFSASFNGGPAVPVAGCQDRSLFFNAALCVFTPGSSAGPGSYAITASYGGDTDYVAASGSASVPALARTSLALAPSPTPRAGSPATVTATISPVPDGGTVSFTVTGPNGRRVTLPAGCTAAPASTGAVACTFTPAAKGDYRVSAGYSGDSLYLTSSAALEVRVS